MPNSQDGYLPLLIVLLILSSVVLAALNNNHVSLIVDLTKVALTAYLGYLIPKR